MNKSARILSYVVFVFAIAAVVLSLLLALRRDEFRGRADKMAKLLMDMAKIMDTNSSTNLAKDTWIKPADPLTKPPTPETGTLSWPRYHATKGEDKDPSKQYIEFDKTLTKSRELVKELQKQRDYLADRLVETALTIGLPEEQFKSDDLKKALKNLKDIKPGANRYEEASKIITDFATHVNTRDKAMIKSIVNAAAVIKHPVDEKKFVERQMVTDDKNNTIPSDFGHEAVLADFNDKIKALHTRATTYADTIVQGIERVQKHPDGFDWTTNKDLVKSETEYTGAMASLLADCDEIQKQLVILDDTKEQLAKKIRELRQTTEERDQVRAELRAEKASYVKLNNRYTKVKEKLQKLFPLVTFDWDADEIIIPFVPKPNLHAKVVQVNEQYQFVIINIGWNEIREGYPLMVSRGQGETLKLIKLGMVTRAFNNYSIVELLANPMLDRNVAMPGDDVYLSK